MVYGFGDCRLDVARFELVRGGGRVEVEPQVLELLVFLIENRGRLLSKDAILDAVWKGRIVSDSALSSRIKAARQAIGDNGRDQRLIETQHGRGFRFVGEVEATGAASAAAAPAPPPDGPPAIAVLPFANYSDDPANDLLADGITEEIITGLSQFRWFPVIARNSVQEWRGRGVDVREVGAALGVDYVVEGSLLRQGDGPARVHAQLIEAATGRHVSATRLDLDPGDLLALLDRITAGVVGALQPELLAAELGRAERTAPRDRSAWQLFIRAQNLLAGPGAEANAEARRLLGEAIAREPGAARAHAGLALTHIWDVAFGWTNDLPAALAAARDAAARALALGPVDGWALIALGSCRLVQRDHASAIAELARAVACEPNSALAHGTLALAQAFAGDGEAALASAAVADRLSPADRRAAIWVNAEGLACVLLGRNAEALRAGRRITALQPDYPAGHRIVAAAAAGLGEQAVARAAVDRLLELIPGHRVAHVRATLPFATPALAETYFRALVRAGLPE